MPSSSSPAERAAEQRAPQKDRSPRNPSPEEVLRRAAAYGVDLSQLRERLRLSPTERIEYHQRFLKFVLDVRKAGAEARR